MPRKAPVKSLKALATTFGIKQRKLREDLNKQLKIVRATAAPTAAAAGVPVILVPKGALVDLTVTSLDNATNLPTVSSEVILNHVVLPPQEVYHLQPLLLDGQNALAWLITPATAPWHFEVDLLINGVSQTLDQGAGTTVSDPILNQAILQVS